MENPTANYLQNYINIDAKAQLHATSACESLLDSNINTNVYSINSTCFNLIYKKYQKTALVLKEKNIIIIGHKNSILIDSKKTKDSLKVIAGSNTKIEVINKLSFVKDSNLIALFNDGKEKSLLVFDTSTGGNVFPMLIYKISSFLELKDIEFLQETNQVKIIKDNGESEVFEILK